MRDLLLNQRRKAAFVGLGLFSLLLVILMFLNLGERPTLKHLERSVWPQWIYPTDSEEGKDHFKSARSDNIQRLQQLRKQCDHFSGNGTQWRHLNHLIVSEKYKTMFCYIPKVACSQWKKIFIALTGEVNADLLNMANVHGEYQKHLNFLEKYPTEKQTRMLKEYKKYIIVRNPLERVLSFYRDKIVLPQTLIEQKKEIVKRYRANATNATLESFEKSNQVTFLEWVRYLVDNQLEPYNEHWEMYSTLCNPCFIKYDFIGKYETIARDADFILKDIGAPPEVRFLKRSEIHVPLYKRVVSTKEFNHFFSHIPSEYIAKLWNLYETDSKLFGYFISDTFRMMPNVPQ